MDPSSLATHVQRASNEIREQAEIRSIPLRLVGSYAVRTHCRTNARLLDLLERDSVNDLDFASERRFGKEIQRLFAGLGYAADPQIELATDGQHRYFVHPESGLGVDIYLGGMNYCHPIVLEGRLGADPTTIPLAELLLAKLQIVELTEKDVKDVVVLLVEHDVGLTDDETVNERVFASVLARDWGFYHTVTTNLARVRERLPLYVVLTEGQRGTILDRLSRLERTIETQPKDRRWKIRAKIGTRVRWYQSVEEK